MTLNYEVNQYGTKFYTNAKGQRHHAHGPAVEFSDGDKYWYRNDKLHRADGPAIEYADGSKYWYLNGEFLTEAQFNKRTKPVVKAVKAVKVKSTYYVNRSGTKSYRNAKGQLHRTGGPAVECADGYKAWYRNDKLHRNAGPAIECVNGTKKWYLNGESLTEAQFNKRTKPVVKAVRAVKVKLQTIEIDGVTYKLIKA